MPTALGESGLQTGVSGSFSGRASALLTVHADTRLPLWLSFPPFSSLHGPVMQSTGASFLPRVESVFLLGRADAARAGEEAGAGRAVLPVAWCSPSSTCCWGLLAVVTVGRELHPSVRPGHAPHFGFLFVCSPGPAALRQKRHGGKGVADSDLRSVGLLGAGSTAKDSPLAATASSLVSFLTVLHTQ